VKNNSTIDEFPIQRIPDTPLWSENYALMLANPSTSASIYYSCGRWLGDPTIWREVIGVVLPSGNVLVAKNYGRNSSVNGPGASLSTLNILEPEQQLQLRFSGPVVETTDDSPLVNGYRDGPKMLCTIDLLFDAVTPVWNMKGDSREAATIAGSMHIEQIGSVTGIVAYDGQSHQFENGYGVRDHSRGVRDVSNYRWHCWLNGRFPGDRFFCLYAMQLQGSETIGMSNACIFEDGKIHAAQLLHGDLLVDPEDYHRLHTFVIGSDLGQMEVRVSQVLTNFFTSMIYPYDILPGWIRYRSSAVMMDQLVTFEWEKRKGIGWSEVGFARCPLSI